jgi:hypothetical protein
MRRGRGAGRPMDQMQKLRRPLPSLFPRSVIIGSNQHSALPLIGSEQPGAGPILLRNSSGLGFKGGTRVRVDCLKRLGKGWRPLFLAPRIAPRPLD